MTKDEDFPYVSDDPELKPPLLRSGVLTDDQQAEQEFRILLRFLLGSAVEGNDEFWRRARKWQAEIEKARITGNTTSPAIETEGERLRYALIGLFFQALDTSSDSLRSIQRISGRAYNRVTRLASPLTNSRLMRPVRHSVDHMVSKGEAVFASWIQTGRQEELLSRSLVREQAYDDLVDGVLDYVAQKPEVRDLIQDQSVGMGEEIIGEFRTRSSDVDTLLADKVGTIFRRSGKQSQPVQSK